jgi:hypothetical protein
MENNDPQKAKIEKFRAMGIPIPMEKPAFEQPILNVKDPKMLQRIQEIRSGAKKEEINTILTTGDKNPAFKPLPEPKAKGNLKSGQQTVKAPQLESFAPANTSSELSLAATLFDDIPSAPAAPAQRGQGSRMMESTRTNDSMGSDFLSDIRSRIQAKASSGGFQMPSQTSGFGFREDVPQMQNEGAMQSMVQSIASEVAKKVAAETIKTVLDEYLSKRTNLNEGAKNTYKKVKDDIVLIEGKYYKLVPVKVKSKQ